MFTKSFAVAALVLGLMATHANAQSSLSNATLVQSGTGITSSYANGSGSISIYAVGPGLPPNGVTGSATLTYWIEIVGPENITVPLDFTANGTADGLPSANEANVAVTAQLGSNTALSACGSGAESGCPGVGVSIGGQSFGGTNVYKVPTNTPIQVQLTANWNIDCCGDGYFGGAVAQGSVTTGLTIDPGFTRKGYTLFVSAGTNPNPVSLLSTLQDELTGFGNASLELKATHVQTDLQASCTTLAALVSQLQKQAGNPTRAPAAAQLVANSTAIESLIGCN